MKRNFYLVIRTLRKFLNEKELPFCQMVFKDSDVVDHLADKLFTYNNRNPNPFTAMCDFYESLDTEHQLMFDEWFNREMDAVESRTTPYPTA